MFIKKREGRILRPLNFESSSRKLNTLKSARKSRLKNYIVYFVFLIISLTVNVVLISFVDPTVSPPAVYLFILSFSATIYLISFIVFFKKGISLLSFLITLGLLTLRYWLADPIAQLLYVAIVLVVFSLTVLAKKLKLPKTRQ